MDHQPSIRNLSQATIILDADTGHCVDCNEAALLFFQLSREEMLTKSPFELSPLHIYGYETTAYSRQMIQQTLAGENPVFDWIHVDKNGNQIPCELRLIRCPPYSKNLVRSTIIDKRSADELFLSEKEERLRLALESTKLGTFDWYPKQERMLWDDRLCSIFEIDPKSAIDLNEVFYAHIHPDDKERVTKKLERAVRSKSPAKDCVEYRVVINGKVKHIISYTKMIRDKQGDTIRMLGISQDITELRESEEELRKSENLFRSIVQDQEEMIVRWKPGGIRTFANRSYREKFNLSEEEIFGSSFYELIDNEDRKAVIAELESLTPQHPVATNVHRVQLPDSTTGWQEWTDRALFDEKGNICEYQSVGHDITEMVLARNALEESEERFRNVFNQQFQFTAVLNLDGKVEQINDLLLKVQKKIKADYLGKFFWESPAWEGNKEWQRKVERQVMLARKTEKQLLVEDPYYDAHQKTCYALSSYSLIKNNQGKPINILVQAMDVTEEKRFKREITEQKNTLSNIFNVTSDILVLIRADKGYRIEAVNEAFLTLSTFFGKEISRAATVGKSIEWFFHEVIALDEDEILKRYKQYERVRETRERISYIQRLDRQGRTLITDMVLSPVISAGEVTHILIRLADITQQELAKIELQEAYTELAALKESIELENSYLKEEIRREHDFENMVFKSAAFRRVLNLVEQVAKTDATVLITGETGTGKELIARAIHNISNRADKPMIKVNTAAIPRDLIESELFGYEKGAFTGAVGEKPGKFELADRGTIFLDEIGDMPMDLQVKILRVVQEGEVERLGSVTSKKIDVRIISATNKDLKSAVGEGKFREDLYFRLNVFPIEIPPLRSRLDDIPILVQHFVAKYSVKHSKPVKVIPKSVMEYFIHYPWPGNVRELENTIERAIILTNNEKLELLEVIGTTSSQEQWEPDNSLEKIQIHHIRKVLAECDWKIEGSDGAAKQLKIKASTLRDKMKKFGISRPEKT